MDITIDVGSLYFGLKSVEQVEANLVSFSESLGQLNVSSELPSAYQLTSVKNTLNEVINTDIRELRIKLENSKTIIEENDAEAAMLFGYMEQGYINEDMEFVNMPFMDQTDYGDVRYSAGSVATSGCGLTAVCMVATYLTGELYTPDELAPLVNNAGTNVDKMTKAADIAGLNWYCNESTSRNDLVQMLSEGKLVVCLVKSSSHFVVCRGLTEDGKILVNDPYGPWAKDTGYTMEELNMSAGKTWVFDPADNQVTNNNGNLGDVTISNAVVSKIDNVSGTTLLSGEDLPGVVVSDDVEAVPAITLRQEPSLTNGNNNSGVSNVSSTTSGNSSSNVVGTNSNSSSNVVGTNSNSNSNTSNTTSSLPSSNKNVTVTNTGSNKGSVSGLVNSKPNTSTNNNSYRGGSSSNVSSGSGNSGGNISKTTAPVTAPKTSAITTPVVEVITTPLTTPVSVPVTSPVAVTIPQVNKVTTPITSPVVETTPVIIPDTTPVTQPVTMPVTQPVVVTTTTPVTSPIMQPTSSAPVTHPVTVDGKSGISVPLILGALGTAAVGGVAYKVIKDKNKDNEKKDIKIDNFKSYDEDEIIIPDSIIEDKYDDYEESFDNSMEYEDEEMLTEEDNLE